ncbi:antibiotic biosynthesis monooxygenase [Microbacterium sp. cx-59]|uniref:antibiotic biosynthesis monooxygenase family protein n=1 Tax=Microbacterium sp. cx-59 TaxID=2891207 RepID=UPI001E3E7010|nr:antibiotic biosynthesis monooxygenase [Microbacterium sp. cx-59]MCC4908549.1 antibiotic biosynthesis monooxygenase [Microbacterium sp. cx-59]
MILEHAILPVRAGAASDFEAAFAAARPLIAAQPGFRSLRLSRSVETPQHYLLLVEWDSVAAHTEGFRESAAYEEWKALLHHFYEPFPVVEHFVPVDVDGARAESSSGDTATPAHAAIAPEGV